MADWEMFAGDLYPPLPLILTDSNGPITLASAESVDVLAASATHEITGACTILQVSFTGTVEADSDQITDVSSTTGLWLPDTVPWPSGSTLFADGYLPAPTGSVGDWTLPTILSIADSTITMSAAALADGTGITILANVGYCQYEWADGDTANPGSYSGVSQITWTSGSKVQTVPNSSGAEWSLTIDPLPSSS